MNNLEKLMKCRVVKSNNSTYLVDEDNLRWTNLENGIYFFVSKYQYFKLVECAYKTFNDYLIGKPYYVKNTLLDDNTKEWLGDIVKVLKKVDKDTLTLSVEVDINKDKFCRIDYANLNGDSDYISLPNFKNIIYDFSNLDINKIYTFEELGIVL